MNDEEFDTVGIPVILLALGCFTILDAHLNIPLFRGITEAFGQLPDALWINLTLLGDGLVTLALLSLLTVHFPQALPGGLLAALFSTVLVHTLKPLLAAERPLATLGDQVHVLGIALHNLSFPSGHTAAAFTLMGIYAHALQHKRATSLLFLFALLIGCSRIAVGAHWPADVLGGAAIGWLSAWLGWKMATRWNWGASSKGQKTLSGLFLLFPLLLFGFKNGYPHTVTLQMGIAVLTTLAALITLWKTWRLPANSRVSFANPQSSSDLANAGVA